MAAENNELKAENAKLLEIIADLEEMLPKSERLYIHKTANAIADDNAKLRELVRDMYHVIATLEEANDEAVVRGGVMLDAAHFANRMHELGVKVET